MPTIAAVVAQLAADPKPVIWLDTCDILEVVQCLDWDRPGAPRSVACIEPARRLLNTLAVDPGRALVVITDLVRTEWDQNIAEVREKALRFLAAVDIIFDRPYQAAAATAVGLPTYTPVSASTLVADLEAYSAALLNQATRLDLSDALIGRALARVMTKRRPSHDGHVKDSINFEHYIEIARNLRAGGFAEEVVFVSKNRKDYWDGTNPRIHMDLQPEITDPTVRLGFFGSLEAALGYLHI